MEKLQELKDWIRREEGAVVAFSGGVDSALLAYVAHDVLGSSMIAVTGESASVPERDRKCAKEFCEGHGIPHRFIETHEFKIKEYRNNPENRCYFCKGELFRRLLTFAEDHGYRRVFDGTNASDLSGHRPGYRAIREFDGVKAPYVELGITKADIREMSKRLGLKTADKPASACLASRISTGMRIDERDLRTVDAAEEFLRGLGLTQVRVRHHGELARIQVVADELTKVVGLGEKIDVGLKGLGYRFVTVDLKCYIGTG